MQDPRPEENISSISVQGPAGVLCTIGIVLIALLGLSEARWFLLFSLPVGLVVAGILRYQNGRQSEGRRRRWTMRQGDAVENRSLISQ